MRSRSDGGIQAAMWCAAGAGTERKQSCDPGRLARPAEKGGRKNPLFSSSWLPSPERHGSLLSISLWSLSLLHMRSRVAASDPCRAAPHDLDRHMGGLGSGMRAQERERERVGSYMKASR
jgi:hypothetical protein